MKLISFTFPTFHFANPFPLKFDASLNIDPMSSTFEVSQFPNPFFDPVKSLAPLNISLMLVTELVSHFDKSPLKDSCL